MSKFLIILSNRSGELDRRTATNADEIQAAVIDIASNTYFEEGDSIRIIEQEEGSGR